MNQMFNNRQLNSTALSPAFRSCHRKFEPLSVRLSKMFPEEGRPAAKKMIGDSKMD
jgi:hypothetical protein